METTLPIKQTHKPDLKINRFPWWVHGVACCYLGFGSGIFHASLTRWGQQLDVASMYALILALIIIGIGMLCPRIPVGRRFRSVPIWPVLAGLTIVGDVLLYVYKWSMSSRYVLTTLILMVIIVGGVHIIFRYRQFKVWWCIISVIMLFAGVYFRQIDVAGRFTGPDAWLQGHVLWHFLTAASLGTCYLFFRSERGE